MSIITDTDDCREKLRIIGEFLKLPVDEKRLDCVSSFSEGKTIVQCRVQRVNKVLFQSENLAICYVMY